MVLGKTSLTKLINVDSLIDNHSLQGKIILFQILFFQKKSYN